MQDVLQTRRQPAYPPTVAFHPFVVLGTAFAGAVLFSLAVCLCSQGGRRYFLLFYFTPIGVPFIAYLFDRARGLPALGWVQRGLDLCVVALSLTRAVKPQYVPLVSGHALFLTFALLTTRSRVAQVTAALVMLQVCYLKIVWHDPSLFGGIVAGVAAAALFRSRSRLPQ